MEDVLSWNDYFMEIAKLSARRSKDPKTRVGCCIVNPDTKHILGIGYNGLPYGMNDKEFNWDETDNFDKNPYVVHAEANAILNSSVDISGSIVYVTMFPCCECAKLLAQKRIDTLIFLEDKFKNKETGHVAAEILYAAGVSIFSFDDIKKLNVKIYY